MTVRIDPDLCTVCGLCLESAPDLFTMGEDLAEVVSTEVPDGMEKEAEAAANDCPAGAILIG